MDTNTIDVRCLLNDKNSSLSKSDKQNILGELYNENLKDLKAEYKFTTKFEKTLDKEIVCYINFMFLKYGKIFFKEKISKEPIIKNNKTSFKYFKKSAIKNNSNGQYNLAVSYYYGIGIKQNFNIALKYLKKAAQQKNPKAQYALATMYLEGLSVRKNIEEAIYYFKQASNQNHILATIMLAAMYKFGIKCEIDEERAEQFINKIKN